MHRPRCKRALSGSPHFNRPSGFISPISEALSTPAIADHDCRAGRTNPGPRAAQVPEVRRHLDRCRRRQPEPMDRWGLAIPDIRAAGDESGGDRDRDAGWGDSAQAAASTDAERAELVAKLSGYFARATARKAAASAGIQSAKVAESRRAWDEEMARVREEAQKSRDRAAGRRDELEAASRARTAERRSDPPRGRADRDPAPLMTGGGPPRTGSPPTSPPIAGPRAGGGIGGGLFRGAVPGAPRTAQPGNAAVEGSFRRGGDGGEGGSRAGRAVGREEAGEELRRGLRTAPAVPVHERDEDVTRPAAGRRRLNRTLPDIGGGGMAASLRGGPVKGSLSRLGGDGESGAAPAAARDRLLRESSHGGDARWEEFFRRSPSGGPPADSGQPAAAGRRRQVSKPSAGAAASSAGGGVGGGGGGGVATGMKGVQSASAGYGDLLQDPPVPPATAAAGSRRRLLPTPGDDGAAAAAVPSLRAAASAEGRGDALGGWSSVPARGAQEEAAPHRGGGGAAAGNMDEKAQVPGRTAAARQASAATPVPSIALTRIGLPGAGRDRSVSPQASARAVGGGGEGKGRPASPSSWEGLSGFRSPSFVEGRGGGPEAGLGARTRSFAEGRSRSGSMVSADRLSQLAAAAQAHVDTVHKGDRLLHDVDFSRAAAARNLKAERRLTPAAAPRAVAGPRRVVLTYRRGGVVTCLVCRDRRKLGLSAAAAGLLDMLNPKALEGLDEMDCPYCMGINPKYRLSALPDARDAPPTTGRRPGTPPPSGRTCWFSACRRPPAGRPGLGWWACG